MGVSGIRAWGTTKERKKKGQHVGGLSGPTQTLVSMLFRKKGIWEQDRCRADLGGLVAQWLSGPKPATSL